MSDTGTEEGVRRPRLDPHRRAQHGWVWAQCSVLFPLVSQMAPSARRTRRKHHRGRCRRDSARTEHQGPRSASSRCSSSGSLLTKSPGPRPDDAVDMRDPADSCRTYQGKATRTSSSPWAYLPHLGCVPLVCSPRARTKGECRRLISVPATDRTTISRAAPAKARRRSNLLVPEYEFTSDSSSRVG